MQNEWKPIESAPLNGEVIIAWCRTFPDDAFNSPIIVSNYDGRWIGHNGSVIVGELTHWMHLPDPPRKPVTFTKEQKVEFKKLVEANKRVKEIGTVLCLYDLDGLLALIDALPE